MYRSKWRNTLNGSGFTFVEALFQVVVFILFAQFIAYFYIWSSQLGETFTSTDEVNWELFIHDINRYFENVIEISIDEQEIMLKRPNDEKQIIINMYKDIIRMQKEDKGNVPLLIGIRNAQFSYIGNKLIISVEFLNGLKKERTIFVEISQE